MQGLASCFSFYRNYQETKGEHKYTTMIGV